MRRRYTFVVVGYVVMPEHFHLLISEPERGNPSTVMQVLKQRFARKVLRDWRKRSERGQNRLWEDALNEGHVWQRRFYDFVVWSEGKRVEKLRYMHRNPVKRGLALEPEQWAWSSFRYYAYGEPGAALVNEQRPAQLRVRDREEFVAWLPAAHPSKTAKDGAARYLSTEIERSPGAKRCPLREQLSAAIFRGWARAHVL